MPQSRLIPLIAIAAAILFAAILIAQRSGGRPYRFDPNAPLHSEFSGENAYNHVQAQVGFGPRPAGSLPLDRTRAYLESTLQGFGWQTQLQEFEAPTPIGPIQFANVRARFGSADWSSQVELLLGSHIDTKLYREFRFVGANDAGSSTGVLLEIARVAAQRPDFARLLELIFFDG